MDRRLLVLALGMFANGTDSFVFAGILPRIAAQFHVSIGAAGQLTTVYSITFALLAPTVAAIAAHVPRKRLLISGLCLFVVANIATILSPTLAVALVTRAVAGLGAAMFSPTASGTGAMLVPPEKRGFALAVVLAGLTTSTALGAPIGTVIGGLASWHWSLVFVAALGAAAALGIWTMLPEVPLPPAVPLSKRLKPLTDSRIGLTLLATLLAQTGTFVIYTYFAVVFDRAVGNSATVLGGLLVLFGLAGTTSNILTGRLVDKIGVRKVAIFMMSAVASVMLLMPSAGAHLWSAAIVVMIWGACGWGIQAPQQYRLVSLAPTIAPVVVGLNASATYFGVSIAGVVGAAAIPLIGSHALGYLTAGIVLGGLIASELATRAIQAAEHAQTAAAPSNASAAT